MATFKTLGGRTIELETEISVNEKIAEANKKNYKDHGSLEFKDVPSPSADIIGWVFNITDSFVTDSRFVEGSGIQFGAGTNIVVINDNGVYKYDVLAATDNMATDAQVKEIIDDIWPD